MSINQTSNDRNREILQQMKTSVKDLLSVASCLSIECFDKLLHSNLEYILNLLDGVLNGVTSNERVSRWNVRISERISIVVDIAKEIEDDLLLENSEKLAYDTMHLMRVARDISTTVMYREFVALVRGIIIQNETLTRDPNFASADKAIEYLNSVMYLNDNLNRDSFVKMLKGFMVLVKSDNLTMSGMDGESACLLIFPPDMEIHFHTNPIKVIMPFALKPWWEKISSVPYESVKMTPIP
jgi:hypothetical protein